MKKTILLSAVVIALFLWPLCAQAAIVYEVIDLGTLGGPGSAALSINDAGQIVGEADDHATLFDSTGAGNNIDLGALGGDSSSAYSINNAGQIVGWAMHDQWHGRATLFDPIRAGNNIDLGTLGGDQLEAIRVGPSPSTRLARSWGQRITNTGLSGSAPPCLIPQVPATTST
jgi:probable HAF family extracellular repeat protein